jgi:hypothetical protein
MKKLLFGLLVPIVAIFMIAGLPGLSPAQTPAKKEAPKTPAGPEPARGGSIRILTSVISPKAMGYIPEWGPN